MEKNSYRDAEGNELPYRLLTPERLEAAKRYPLVLFLHGAGERGTDNEAQLKHGVPEFLQPAVRWKYPCFLAAPQCPSGQWWTDWSERQQAELPTEPLRMAIELLNRLERDYSIDAARIYVTGLSMGGFGTWDLLWRLPQKFAAAVPICGGGHVADAPRIAHVPVWAFHGALDDVVSVSYSRTMIDVLRRAGGQPRYTEYPDVGHDSWTPAYRAPGLFDWLFAQRRPVR